MALRIKAIDPAALEFDEDDEKGIVTAVFSTFNTIDMHGDWTPPDAMEEGAKFVVSQYGHSAYAGELPAGDGYIKLTRKEARAVCQFYMDTPHGKATFRTVKRLHESGLGEWSYGYEPTEYHFEEKQGRMCCVLDKIKVFEVSPVLRGAGVNTRTIDAKSGASGASVSLCDQITEALGGVDVAIEAAERVAALRADAGKSLSGANLKLLSDLDGALKRLRPYLEVPRDDHETDPAVDALAAERLRFEVARSRI
jgi:hypothetical protein